MCDTLLCKEDWELITRCHNSAWFGIWPLRLIIHPSPSIILPPKKPWIMSELFTQFEDFHILREVSFVYTFNTDSLKCFCCFIMFSFLCFSVFLFSRWAHNENNRLGWLWTSTKVSDLYINFVYIFFSGSKSSVIHRWFTSVQTVLHPFCYTHRIVVYIRYIFIWECGCHNKCVIIK